VLELDPVTAPVVARIFRDYLNGVGIWALAETSRRCGRAEPGKRIQEKLLPVGNGRRT